MDPNALAPLSSTVWVWIAAPLAGLAALVVTIRLKAPQLLRLPEALRALRSHDEGAEGSVHPATAVAFGAVASYGAAAAVGAATAVSLGGAGAVAWVWLFAFLLAPLRMAEAVLARTAPPGRAGEGSGTLAGRLLDDSLGGMRALGWLLLVLVPIVGLTFYGGFHGGAVLEAAEQLLPGSGLTLGLVVAGVGALVALLPPRKAGPILGWIAAVALIALFGAALVAFFSSPGRGFGGFGRAVMDALYDAPRSGAFTGAAAGEIAMAATLYVLPPVAATGAVDGALQAEAQAPTTRAQATAALLGPIFYGILTTLVGLSLVATNAFTQPIEDTRPVRELTFWRTGFDTVSQRREQEWRYDGFIRVTDGETGIVRVHVATERGMVRAPRFEDAGEPADVALHVRGGTVDNLQRPGHLGALENRPLAELDQLHVRGRMLPRGGRLLAASMTRGGGPITSRAALAALLLLAALGAAAWGLGIAKTLRAKIPAAAARWAAILPGVGLALAALGVIPGLAAIGLALAGLSTAVVAIALTVRSGEAAALTKK